MGVFTKLAEQEIQAILEQYHISTYRDISVTEKGISNTNYIINGSSQSWILKISNDKTLEQLKSELEILAFLNDENFQLAPLPLKCNEKYYFQSGQNFGVLYPFTIGEIPQISKSLLEQMGKVLQKLHTIETSGTSLRSYSSIGHTERSVLDFIDSKACPDDFKKTFKASGLHLPLPTEKLCLVHGDFYYDNALVGDDGRILKMLDFEQAGIGNPLLDIGIALSGSCFQNDKFQSELVESFCVGYGQYFSHLETMIKWGLFSVAQWRIERFIEKELDESLKYSYQHLLSRVEIL